MNIVRQLISLPVKYVALTALSLMQPLSVNAETICTVISDATNKILRQEGACSRQVTPASTFKIAISLMGYDSGFLVDEHSPALAFHEGYPDWLPEWKTTTDPTSWIKHSVVWYSQQITQHMGERRFQKYVTAFDYGNKNVSGDPGRHNGLTRAWLNSSLRISPLEQVAFLNKVVNRQLALAPRAFAMTDHVTLVGTTTKGWEIHGKTGTGNPMRADGSIDQDRQLGWFVGWASQNNRTLVFARLIDEKKTEATRAGLTARNDFMLELPSLLDALGRDGNHPDR